MKKIIIILAMVFAAGAVFSQEAETSTLKFNYQMELGYLPLDGWNLHETIYTASGLNFYMTLKAEVLLLDFIFAGGHMRTNASFKTDGTLIMNPSEIWFGFNAGLRFGGLEIGFRHACFHPLMIYINQMGQGSINAEGAYEELYISFKGSVKLF